MLKIKDLVVKIKDSDKTIINKLSLEINKGEIHVLMGPNGTGKSSLAKTIMGYYKYDIVSGEIYFNNDKLNDLSPDQRAKKRIFLAMQDPTEIEGVTNSEFLKTSLEEVTGERVNLYDFINVIESSCNDLKLDKSMLHRAINKGFSGGEKKKNEILEMKVLKPKLILLDEIDSGLDVDSLRIVCENIKNYLKENSDASILLITHYPKILEYLKPDFVHIMKDGYIKETGDLSLAKKIEKFGFNSINNVEESDVYE